MSFGFVVLGYGLCLSALILALELFFKRIIKKSNHLDTKITAPIEESKITAKPAEIIIISEEQKIVVPAAPTAKEELAVIDLEMNSEETAIGIDSKPLTAGEVSNLTTNLKNEALQVSKSIKDDHLISVHVEIYGEPKIVTKLPTKEKLIVKTNLNTKNALPIKDNDLILVDEEPKDSKSPKESSILKTNLITKEEPTITKPMKDNLVVAEKARNFKPTGNKASSIKVTQEITLG